MYKLLLVLVSMIFLSGAGWNSEDICGVWLNQHQDAKVKIYNSKGKYYGMIVWLKTPIDPETGKAKLDKHNPDKSLRTRPIQNLEILKDLKFDADDHIWTDGDVYDPKSGNTYSLTCKLKTKDIMELRGYMGVSLLGRTDIWTRSENK